MRITITIISLLLSGTVLAQPLPDLLAEIGVGNSIQTDNDVEGDTTFVFKAGWKPFPIYLAYSSADDIDVSDLGQGVGKIEAKTYGLGARFEHKTLSAFTEFSYADLDWQRYPSSHEVAYTGLVGRHAVEGRPSPVACGYDACYDSTYSIDDNAWGITVGLGWQIWKHLKVTASYTWMEADKHISIQEEGNPLRWEENGRQDLGSANMTILATW